MPPAGSYFLDSGNVRNYFVQRSVLQRETRYTLRLDHSFTDKAKANFRYTAAPTAGIRSAGNDTNGNSGLYELARQLLLRLNNINVEQRYNINDIVYWTRGNKTWKFGADLSDARLTVTPFFAASGGRWQFRALNTSNNRANNPNVNGGIAIASLLLGVSNQVDFRPLLLDYDYRWKSTAFFAQNDWKVRPNFMLNLGLRYSLQLPRSENHNLQGAFRPD